MLGIRKLFVGFAPCFASRVSTGFAALTGEFLRQAEVAALVAVKDIKWLRCGFVGPKRVPIGFCEVVGSVDFGMAVTWNDNVTVQNNHIHVVVMAEVSY